MTTAPALLATGDDALLDDLVRLAAAAGTPVVVGHDVEEVLRVWAGAPLVLVGEDLAGRLGSRRPARREGVHLVGHGPLADAVFRDALGVGAYDVVELPDGESRLVELLADAGDGPRGVAAPVIGVVAGSGGAGASTFAAALAQRAAGTGSVVVDLDRWGSGQARLVGVEDEPGVHWEDLADARGRLGSHSLRASLPARDGVAVLSWSPERALPVVEPSPPVVDEVLRAAQRGSGLVVVDLPRPMDGVAAEVVARCRSLVLVCEGSVGSVLAAARVAGRARLLHERVGLVVRGSTGGVPPDRVARSLGLPLVADYRSRRAVAEQVELGFGPLGARRSSLARAAARTLDALTGDGVEPR